MHHSILHLITNSLDFLFQWQRHCHDDDNNDDDNNDDEILVMYEPQT